MTYEPTPSDRDLEFKIEHQYLLLQAATAPHERRAIWEMFKHLKGQRTEGMVRYLERHKGIAT